MIFREEKGQSHTIIWTGSIFVNCDMEWVHGVTESIW